MAGMYARLPRPGGPDGDRRADAPPRRRARRRFAHARPPRADARVLRYARRAHRRCDRSRARAGCGGADQLAPHRRRDRRDLRRRDDDRTRDRNALGDLLTADLPAFAESSLGYARLDETASDTIPEELRRSGEFMTHPVFQRHRSETEMMRYLRALADKDLALDRTMIPLGSCTMKLNAATEMLADHLARVRADPSVRAARASARVPPS